MKWGGSGGGEGEGFGAGGSIEVPKLKQLTSKTCKNIILKQSILNAINS